MPRLSNKYFSVKEIAELFDLKERVVRKEVGQMNAVKFGREWRIPAEGIENYLKNNTLQSNKKERA